jgi:hypothetical protein
MPPLELSTTFRGISSSPKARAGLSPKGAADQAKANLRYITREAAASGGFLVSDGDGVRRGTDADLQDHRDAITARAEQGGKRGIRVAEKMMISLPNDWPGGALREAVDRVAKVITPPGSEARAIIALHTDKPRNRHIHINAIDGLESLEAARERTPEGQRPRRRNALRMGEMGRPRELRQAIAETLNQVADARGLSRVEWRSYEARGVDQIPMLHRGPPLTPRKGRDRAEETPQAVPAPTKPKEAQEAATKPIPQQIPQSPPAPTPQVQTKRVYRAGRWMTVPADEATPPKKRRRQQDDEGR